MPKKKKRIKRTSLRKIKSVPRGTYKLPIQTATFVPATTKGSKKITKSALKRRVNETRRFLSKLFGGYTSIKARGGYISKKKGLIRERVVVIVAYAERLGFLKKKKRWINWVKKRRKQWGQESMGIIIENDMFYIK